MCVVIPLLYHCLVFPHLWLTVAALGLNLKPFHSASLFLIWHHCLSSSSWAETTSPASVSFLYKLQPLAEHNMQLNVYFSSDILKIKGYPSQVSNSPSLIATCFWLVTEKSHHLQQTSVQTVLSALPWLVRASPLALCPAWVPSALYPARCYMRPPSQWPEKRTCTEFKSAVRRLRPWSREEAWQMCQWLLGKDEAAVRALELPQRI